MQTNFQLLLDSQGRLKRKLVWYHYLLAGIIALIIDFALLHAGHDLLGFHVPENAWYFTSKLAVIMFAIFLFHRMKSALLSTLATGFLGSGMFSLYYVLTRPDLFGIGDTPGYSDYESAVTYSLEQSVIIYLVHAVGIAVGYAVILAVGKKQKKA